MNEPAGRLPMARDSKEVVRAVQALLDDQLAGRQKPVVLDAGCGARRYLSLPADAYRVGIDVDAGQLERNTSLDEPILGDISSFPLPRDHFDLVICWDVLEHVARPRQALANMRAALAPGGLLVVGGPNPLSLKGSVTWLTPTWFHRAVWKTYAAFVPGSYEEQDTVRRRIGSIPHAICAWARSQALTPRYLVAYESWLQVDLRRRLRIGDRLWTALNRVLLTLTLGLVHLAATDFVVVFERTSGPAD